jgi:Tfp pilus assembly protein PilE
MRSGARLDHGRRTHKVLFTVAGVVVAVLIAGILLLHHYWPFTESAVRADLASASAANVHFAHFHDTYFPPGCVADDVVFQRQDSDHPLITMRRLTIRSYLGGLLYSHVSLIRAEGMHVILTGSDFAKKDPGGQQHVIDRLVADDAVLEIPHKSGKAFMQFVFHKFMMKNLGGNGPVHFYAVFDNPMPRGAIQTEGEFGPWDKSSADETPVSGNYSLNNADMSVFGWQFSGYLQEPRRKWHGEDAGTRGCEDTPRLTARCAF